MEQRADGFLLCESIPCRAQLSISSSSAVIVVGGRPRSRLSLSIKTILRGCCKAMQCNDTRYHSTDEDEDDEEEDIELSSRHSVLSLSPLSSSRPMLAHPVCLGMTEVAYARRERDILNRCQCQNSLCLATDAIQLHLLHGLALTVGSALVHARPCRDLCWTLFTSLPAPNKLDTTRIRTGQTQMHVGGRAFTKHAHRDVTNSWWGTSTGTEANKNAAAEACFERIWEAATWRNVFALPHRWIAFEIRVHEGYGMRFQMSEDGGEQWSFRGFVEPAVLSDTALGHRNKWRH